MKHVFTILCFGLFTLTSRSQTTLTVGQSFDFNVGDEFEYKVSNQPPNIERLKVVEKFFSATQDTVFYTFLKSGYNSVVDYSTNPPHLEYFFYQNQTEKSFYTQLSTNLSDLKPSASEIDSCNTYSDTAFTSNTYCNRQSFLSDRCKNCCFEGESNKLTHSEGLGITVSDYSFPAENIHLHKYMTFFKKGVDSCGSSDKTVSVYEIEQAIIQPTIYPNPTVGPLTIEQIDGYYTIEFINIAGQIVYSEKQKDAAVLNLEHLEKGIYQLSIKSKTRLYNQKILLQ